jgi:ATP-dependent Clp protease ATP-binding subunit ClpA
MFLQIMDYGTLTDNQGRKIDFRNTILIMTSNVGATAAAEHKSVGFGTSDNDMSDEIYTAEINKIFPPEFRNRLDGILMFNSLSKENALDIVRAEVKKIAKRMEEKNITLNVSDDAINLIMEQGYSKEFGGRNIAKTAENLLAEPLIDEILFGNLKNGGTVSANVKDEKIVFNDAKVSSKKAKKVELVEA